MMSLDSSGVPGFQLNKVHGYSNYVKYTYYVRDPNYTRFTDGCRTEEAIELATKCHEEASMMGAWSDGGRSGEQRANCEGVLLLNCCGLVNPTDQKNNAFHLSFH